jgi:hypothetical protein
LTLVLEEVHLPGVLVDSLAWTSFLSDPGVEVQVLLLQILHHHYRLFLLAHRRAQMGWLF